MNTRPTICAVFAGMFLCAPVCAAVKPADGFILSPSTQRIVDCFPAYAGIPAIPGTDRDVNVLVRAGASYTDIVVLGRRRVPPRALARALEASLKGTALAGCDVVYCPDPPYSAAEVQWSRGRPGAFRATNPVPIGAVTDGLRAAGYRPQVMLRIPRHAHRGDDPGPGARSGSFLHYNATKVRTAVVEARLTPLCLALVTMIFGLPVLAALILLSGVRRAKSGDLPLEIRHRLYQSRTQVPLGLIAFGSPCLFAALLTGGHARAFADVFLGTSSYSSVLFAVGGASVVGFLFFGLAVIVSHRLFKDLKKPGEPYMSAEERAIRNRQTFLIEGIKALALVVIPVASAMAKSGRFKDFPWRMLEWPLIILATIIVTLMFRRKLAPYERKTPDAALTTRAQSLAAGTGTIVTQAQVDESLAGRQHIIVLLVKGVLTVSRKAVDTLTPGEMDFLMARTFVRPAASINPFTLLTTALGALAVPAGFGWLLLNRHRVDPFDHWWVLLLPFVPLLLLSFVWGPISARRNEEIDRRALAITRNASAALSAIIKQLMAAVTASTRTSVKAGSLVGKGRYKALLRSAYDMGLPAPDQKAVADSLAPAVEALKEMVKR